MGRGFLSKKSVKKFEVSLAQLQVPLLPTEGRVDFRTPGGKLLVEKATSRAGTIAEAIAMREGLIVRYREGCERGDPDAIAELLLYGPKFKEETWVVPGLLNLLGLVRAGNLKRKPGRRQGQGVVDGMRLVALVNLLVSRGKTKVAALKLIQPHLGGTLSLERMKRIYFQSRKSDRLNSIMFPETLNGASKKMIMTQREINSRIGEEMVLTREVRLFGQVFPAGGSVLVTPALKREFPKGSLRRPDKVKR